MQKAQMIIDADYQIARVEDRLYSFFVEHMGRCVYNGLYEPTHPSADANGFRGDVKELVRSLHIPAIRYPGGNMVSGFDWEDSVGPVERRPRRLELSRTSIEPNTVGLSEFYDYAEEVGAKLIYAVNLGTRGPEEARNLIEYTNHRSGSYYSDLRRANGREQPFGIKTWCLGNEMDGSWQMCHKTAREYGAVARETAKIMRWVDPKIELIAVGSSGMELPTYGQWELDMLDECYEQIDYVAFHRYFRNTETDSASYLASSVSLDEMIRTLTSICDATKGKKHSKKQLHLSFDEWNVLHRTDVERHPERLSMPRPEDAWAVAPALIEHTYTFEDALCMGFLLNTLIRHADRVKIACLAQLVNVIAPIMTRVGGSAWVQSIYWPLLRVSEYGRGVALLPQLKSPVGDCSAYAYSPS
ncbi:MAG: alpha-L-arabinofuranosidase C-terminal domain-containing protein [Eubacteriales bacterium]|nr:alpha-L-arabinofuranosidase C-terminal domain-containing protein [Eubacteriales bacterium]